MARRGFRAPALLRLPAGVAAPPDRGRSQAAAVRFGASAGAFAGPGEAMAALEWLAFLAPCGLPLALGCRRLWRLRYRRAAWTASIGPGAATVPATLFAGLLGPVAIAVRAALLSLPDRIVWLWLARPRIGVPRIGSGAGWGRRG